MFQYENDLRKVMDMLNARLMKFSLEVAVDKTRILPFGSKTGTKEGFDFLGCTFYNAKARYGSFSTCMKKLKSSQAMTKRTYVRRHGERD